MQYYKFKLVVIGLQGVGKKSLINSIDQGHQVDEQITLIDKNTMYVFELTRMISDAICIMFIFDHSNQGTLNYAINQIQSTISQLDKHRQFILLIGNKCDLPSRVPIDLDEYAAQLQIVHISVSVKTGKNLLLLQNILRIKAQQIMKRHHIDPMQVDSLENSMHSTPKRPLPMTPRSDCKSIESLDVDHDIIDIQSISINQIDSIKKLDQKIDNKADKLDSTVRLPIRRNPQPEQTTRSRSANKLPEYLQTSVYSKSFRPIILLSIQIDEQLHLIEVHAEDTYSLMIDRLASSLGRKLGQSTRRHLQSLFEQHVQYFAQEIQRVVTQAERKNLRIKDQVEQFINQNNLEHQYHNNRIKKSIQSQNSKGTIIYLVQNTVYQLHVQKNVDPYDMAFKMIMEHNLKKSIITSLVHRIEQIYNSNNAIHYIGIIDNFNVDLVIFRNEVALKKLYQFCVMNQLDYEVYRLLEPIF